MKTILLAGGYAKRLWPLTKDCPKSLLPIAGKPIIEYILDGMEHIGEIEEVFLSTNRKFETKFKDWLENYRSSKEIELAIEETRTEEGKLGSIGALNFLITHHGLNEDLLIIGGDNLFDFDLKELIAFYRTKKKTVVLLYDMMDKERVRGKYGVLEIDSDLKIINSEEKPEEPKSTLISTACYIFTKEDLALIGDYLAAGNNPDAIGFFVSWLCKRSALYGLVHSGLWFDIGSFDDYERANAVYGKKLKEQ
ncbi:MAG: nucleotidyltransferase family protein [Euryarchaeota archaeon]|nr:nucleotidyltransferase family protein [Euryarchaeota archaeon]